jgi:KUP system potassium uptake protein
MSGAVSSRNLSPRAATGAAALTLGAIGVVFGDIGTSPLYAFQTVFQADHHAVKPTGTDVFGVISLVFWSITLIVSIKFVIFIMRADNHGEGGIMALIALVQGAVLKNRHLKAGLIAAGLFGVALFYGDGMITPAISVMSAVEGVEVAAPSLSSYVLPITIGVLMILFAAQRFGTQIIGRAFGPVMVVWFLVIAAGGIGQILADPEILKALNPTYAVDFFSAHLRIAFISLGAIVLTITGAEALYADMGHFGHAPISRAWFLLVFPALTLCYLGQGSLVLQDPSSVSSPFFLLFPDWSHIPMVILATVATVIASQAVISGAFSVTKQAIQLGFLPRLLIRQTSNEEIGQIYIPAINWALFAAVVVLVLGFGSSAALASAYGIAVVGTLTIDAVLFLVVVRKLWQKPLWMAITFGVVFLTIDFTFLAANLTKIEHGGWFPLSIGLVIIMVISTWDRGYKATAAKRAELEGSLAQLVDEINRMDPGPHRVRGTAIYLNARTQTAPMAFRSTLKRDGIVHDRVIVLSLITARTPYVDDRDRIEVDDLGYDYDGISHVTATIGFMDTPDVPYLLKLANESLPEGPIDIEDAYYYLSNVLIRPDGTTRLQRFRKHLYIAMARNASSPVDHFRLPAERTVIESSGISI